jgi:serine/threonine protein kinase
MNNVKREISILKRVEHPNIIRLYYAIEDKRTVTAVPHIWGRSTW